MDEPVLSEREAVILIREMIGPPPAGVEVGPGDDAAVFTFASSSVILTVDAMFEDIHFSLDTYSYSDIGWKSMASSISDIAAMGGQPACALMSLSLSEPPTRVELESLLEGALEIADRYHCPIVGGDLCRSSSGLGVTVTVAGCPHPSGAILRSGAGVGDVIGVTGELGDSAAGLYILKASRDDMRARYAGLVESHLRPHPRLQAGQALASLGVSAMEDVSDGLAADLANICRASDMGCEVIAADVPVGAETRQLAEESGLDPLDWALAGGEDYELIFTAPSELFEEAMASLAGGGMPASRIGVITSVSSGMKLVGRDGKSTELEGGYDHFL